jgi:hypothetical protein
VAGQEVKRSAGMYVPTCISSAVLCMLTARTVAPSNFFGDMDGRSIMNMHVRVLFHARALEACGYPSPHAGTVQGSDGLDTVSPENPNDVGFAKGEILGIIKRSSDTWRFQRANGLLGCTYHSHRIGGPVCTLTFCTGAPSHYFIEIDGRVMPVLFRAKAVLDCECPSPHTGTVQAADGVQILRPLRNRERLASQKARFSRSWTARTSGGGPRSVYAHTSPSCSVKLCADPLSSAIM